MNILSIDFDFFQKVDKDTLMTCYPDGNDLGTELSKLVWSNYYTKYSKTKTRLEAVKIDMDMLDGMVEIVAKTGIHNSEIPVLIANSHVHVYDFIKGLYKENEDLHVVNVDLHHDMFNNNPNVDCGNWVKHIKDEIKDAKVTWIANAVSKEIFGPEYLENVKYDYSSISDMIFDAIFICRSDMWLPPHLDLYFDYFIHDIGTLFDHVRIEKSVMAQRDIKKLIKQTEDQIDRMRKSENN